MDIIRIFLTGNLTKDPDVRVTEKGTNVTSFTVASNHIRDVAEFFNVATFHNQALFLGKNLKKGDKVTVEGTLRTREWEDKSGNLQRGLSVYADRVVLMFKPKEESEVLADDTGVFFTLPEETTEYLVN